MCLFVSVSLSLCAASANGSHQTPQSVLGLKDHPTPRWHLPSLRLCVFVRGMLVGVAVAKVSGVMTA